MMTEPHIRSVCSFYTQMGVVEAIKASLSALPHQSTALRYLLSRSGDITLSDII